MNQVCISGQVESIFKTANTIEFKLQFTNETITSSIFIKVSKKLTELVSTNLKQGQNVAVYGFLSSYDNIPNAFKLICYKIQFDYKETN